jgi:hypothetical protein
MEPQQSVAKVQVLPASRQHRFEPLYMHESALSQQSETELQLGVSNGRQVLGLGRTSHAPARQ